LKYSRLAVHVVREYHQVWPTPRTWWILPRIRRRRQRHNRGQAESAQARQCAGLRAADDGAASRFGPAAGYYEGQLEALQAELAAIDTRLTKDYSASLLRFYDAQIAGTRASIEQLRARQGKAEARSPVSA
jgi:hypothetical protein